MMRLAVWLLLLLGLHATAGPVRAQESDAGRVLASIELTDRRIDLAASLLEANPEPSANSQLLFARDLQERARAAYSATQYMIAARLTLEARGRADRAVAELRGLPDPDRVESQLDRTRAVLERARDQLSGCTDERARQLVRVGIEMQRRAEASAAESRYLAALQLTMSARERVSRALRICRVEETRSDAVLRSMAQTDEALARAREAEDVGSSEAIRALLARAEAKQAEARNALAAGKLDLAGRMTQQAGIQAQRILRLVGKAVAR
jgi:hypothetical protein